MQIINASEFDGYWKSFNQSGIGSGLDSADAVVREIIKAVRSERDTALRRYAERFDRSSPSRLEVPVNLTEESWETLRNNGKETAAALELAAVHILKFAELQRNQLVDFESEMKPGLFTGQLVIPVEKAAVYIPAGRFPIISSVLMGMIPALAAGVDEIILASPPMEDGFPNRNILAAAALSMMIGGNSANVKPNKTKLRVFAMGGAQAIAALALGTESVPRASVIVGPGNKYVTAAKRMLFGEVGIDLIAGPTDVLIIAGEETTDADNTAAKLIAADMLAQAEHDTDACARVLVSSQKLAEQINIALEEQLTVLPEESRAVARVSIDDNGLIVVCRLKEETIRIANIIAPEHLELYSDDPGSWLSAGKSGMCLKNFGSLFIGSLAAEVLGDYSAGVNHTLPTSGNARFTGGLSVRHFLKIPTTLRCVPGTGYEETRQAAEVLGRAEGLAAHSAAAAMRRSQ
ncbi:MAG: histidinol dehydrogenase [Treponema sp.]|nr:histidinol dehydrogenase [Treponema sp.]